MSNLNQYNTQLRNVAVTIQTEIDDHESGVSFRLQAICDKIHEVTDLIQLVEYYQTGLISSENFIEGFDRLYPTEHKEFINE